MAGATATNSPNKNWKQVYGAGHSVCSELFLQRFREDTKRGFVQPPFSRLSQKVMPRPVPAPHLCIIVSAVCVNCALNYALSPVAPPRRA